MEIHHEELADVRRYIKNQKRYGLQGKALQYERYLRLIRKARKVDSGTRMLEVGTGTGWFRLLCKADGLQCKGLEISPQPIEVAMELGAANGIEPAKRNGLARSILLTFMDATTLVCTK